MTDGFYKKLAINSTIIFCVVLMIAIVCTNRTQNLIYAKNLTKQTNATINKQDSKYTTMFEDNFFNNRFLVRKMNSSNNSHEYLGLIKSIKTIQNGLLNMKYVKIRKNGLSGDVAINAEDLYMERSLKIELMGLNKKIIDKKSIVNSNMFLEDYLKSTKIQYTYDKLSKTYSGTVLLSFDNIYVHSFYQDEKYIYVILQRPKDVYDRVLVIDAGHGGNDIGTSSTDMKFYEKDLNLNIVLELKKLLDQENIKVYYSRLEDKKLYLKQRVHLANDTEADFFISVHCNSSEYSEAHGAEVLYNQFVNEGVINSKKLAGICLSELIDETGSRERDIVDSSSTYIIGHSKVPVALIEVGYMSNYEDLQFMINQQNQKLIAKGIYNGIMRAFTLHDLAQK